MRVRLIKGDFDNIEDFEKRINEVLEKNPNSTLNWFPIRGDKESKPGLLVTISFKESKHAPGFARQ